MRSYLEYVIGRQVFTDRDISALGEKSAAPLYRVYNRILGL